MNKITIVGRITGDLNLRTTQGGKSVVQFGLADNYRIGDKPKTKYHNIVAWGGTAETLCRYCSKGDQLIVAGSLRDRDYTDKDGKYQTITEVLLESFEFGAKKQTQTQAEAKPDVVQEELKEVLSEDSLPF